MSESKPTKSPYIHLTVWNMNGGPIPEKTRRRLEGAMVSIIKDSEPRVRLLHSITVDGQ